MGKLYGRWKNIGDRIKEKLKVFFNIIDLKMNCVFCVSSTKPQQHSKNFWSKKLLFELLKGNIKNLTANLESLVAVM